MLARLERELADEPFVVVGVHSPKFPNERDEDAVRQAVRRYGVTHPVVVDPGRRIWDEFGVNAWPTLMLLDPEGRVAAAGSGEPELETLREAVRSLLPDRPAPPLPLRLEPAPPGALAYPGKVIAAGGRIFVADTGHDQVVEADEQGNELRRFSGFRHPNGLALAGETLYVADTGAHAIAAVELATGEVRRVAGTGDVSRGLSLGGEALETPLRSPWDLAWDGELLYVAMAGAHQIWFYDPSVEEVGVFAGTGHEVRRDGPAISAAFAQPSGLALMDGGLYVADSEISSIRAIADLHGMPTVSTIAGSGELFGFGDRDGVGDRALFQHPMGIAAGDGVLYVADSFNHKIRVVDPSSDESTTLFGGVGPERLPEVVPGVPLRPAAPDEPAFFEPEGLAVLDDRLLVADTNNHRVLAVDLESGERSVLLGS